MISVKESNDAAGCSIEIRPNPPMPLLQRAGVVFLLGMIMLSMGIVYARLGFWPILPFAGLELGLLWWALQYTARRSAQRDVIECDGRELAIHRDRGKTRETVTMPAPWTRVELDVGDKRWHPTRLYLCSGTSRILIGGFLVEEERQRLAKVIREVLDPIRAY